MNIIDLFNKTAPANAKLQGAPTMAGNLPFYSSFGDSVYNSDIVIQSIRCKANEFKKLKPRHIVDKNGRMIVKHDSSIAKVLKRPNPYMTTADFLEKITILLELNKNVFIYPMYYKNQVGEKVYTGIYPLKPATVEYIVDASENYYIQFTFGNGYITTVPLNDVIHWRKDYGVNDYFGGSNYGDVGLMRALAEYDKLLQSISKAVEVSCNINGLMRINSYLDDEIAEKNREDFERKLKNNESGILFTDLKTEYTDLKHDVKLVDSDTLKFYYETILRANGTSLAILNGDYTKQQKEAYYEHAIEADVKSLGQAFTKTIFSEREESYGNEIVLYPNDIAFMSMSEKIEALKAGLPAGIFTKNEARELMGYPPIDGGDVTPRGYNELDDANIIVDDNVTVEEKEGEI